MIVKNRDKNIRGKLIRQFNASGISIAPARPRRKEYVLTGGFITQKYGASQIPNSQAIQIEFSDTIRYKDSELKKKVIKVIAEILFENFF